jgi:hypothetical protein
VFCESVQHRLRFWLDHFSYKKIATFQFFLQSRKERKVGCTGKKSCFWLKHPWWKGSVRRCVVVMQLPKKTVIENDDHSVEFAFYHSRSFRSRWIWTFPWTADAFFPEIMSNHWQGLRRTIPEICRKFDVAPLSDSSRFIHDSK